ncbi:MAG: AAA family ATPase, partial [Bacteroidetes bacterium]|nr:AAA family ATPase [Bacteroidota bacterium]
MKGFKSFARETVIHFNERITGVVGPNGSGKSNVVDAIRWVLGEQKSSELRLEKMGDILFNGTQKRKPAPVARASVTFENDKGLIKAEYSELTITRILYRSGDSEYRLNDVACRLKDIRSVLLDTGIGSNSYAIIALGMVDDILSDKDQARRKMFEQAAGISKYKTRKRETLNKLKLTNADLDRVEDLLHELESLVKQQKRQARRAEKYLKLKDSYRSLSIDLAILNSSQTRDDFKTIKEELRDIQSVSNELTAKISRKQAIVESKKKENLQKESSVSQSQRALSAIVREIQSLENKRDIKRQSISYGEQAIHRLNHQTDENERKIEDLSAAIIQIEKKLQKEKSLLAERQETLAETKAKKEESQKSFQQIKSGRDDRMQRLQR